MRVEHIDGVTIFQAKPVNEPDWEIIATLDDPDDTYTSGLPFIAHEDPFGSANDDGYVLFDNLVIEDLSGGANVNNWNMY